MFDNGGAAPKVGDSFDRILPVARVNVGRMSLLCRTGVS